MNKVSDVDQVGKVLCTYTESEKEGLKAVRVYLYSSMNRHPDYVSKRRF